LRIIRQFAIANCRIELLTKVYCFIFSNLRGKLEAMRKIIYSLSLALMLFGSAKGQVITSGFDWQRCYGGSDIDFAWTLEKTNDGGYAVIGNTQSGDGDVVGHHEGNNTTNAIDTWLLKLDSTGNIQWQRTLGGYTHEVVYSFDYTNDNGFIIAIQTNSINSGDITGNHATRDIWLIKLDSIGATEWEKYFEGSEGDYAKDIQQTSDGGYILFGSTFSNDGDFSGLHDGNDYWIAKLNSLGDIEWEKCLGGYDSEDYNGEVIETNNGDYLICGGTESNDGDVSGNHGSFDAWLVKLNAQGDILWQRCYGGSLYENAHSVYETSDYGYVFTGFTFSNDFDVSGNHGNGDYWVVKTDIDGNIEWQKCYGGSNFDEPFSIQEVSDSGYIVVGNSRSNDGNVLGNHHETTYDAWLIKLNSLGLLEWQKCIGGSSGERITSFIQESDGSLVLAGSADSNDGDVEGVHGSTDFWLVKMKPMILSFDSINSTNCTGNSGSIAISIFGGTPPYTYEWNTNPIQYTEDISNLTPGVYSVTVTDSTGMIVSGSALINGPSTFSGTDLAGHFTATGFRPGVNSQIFIDVTNQGCFPLNGTVVFVLDPWLNYVNAVPPPDNISGDSLFWNLDALTYDSLHFTPVVTVTTDMNAQIGDSVCISLIVLPVESDGDNLQTMCYPVVNSYDPNDKQVSPQGFSQHGFIANNQRMYYTVRFQNTGNAEAIDVFITDTMDANLDFQTLQVYSSSHTMTTELYPGNVVRFVFDDIHLPDSNANEPSSHGYVMYEIDQLPDLAVDTEIENTAYIYFDFNSPVITNTVLNTIYDCSSSFNEPFITASGPLTFCDGDAIVLDAGAGYDDYEWSTGETTQTISVDTTGDYSVAVRVDTCWHYSDTVQLEAHTVEVPISENGQLLISDSTFVSYQWYYNSIPIPTATNQTYCAIEYGNYFVVVTDEFGCTDTSNILEHAIDFPSCDIGINEPENTFTIYPNPATTELTIIGYNPAYIILCNTLGQTVAEATNTNKLQIAELQKGLYLLQVFDKKGGLVRVEKVVKE
jgi:uncharacterized repeat protein (TIGR01451 family)